MKIVVDENISFAEQAFSKSGEVILLPGRKISNQHLKDADALIVRSVTKVDKALLNDTGIKFVGTATIGTDHVDRDFLSSNNIHFADAAGCNADAVAEYVFTSLFTVAVKHKIKLSGLKLGVVGAGNIGSRVVKIAESLGLNVYVNDPPLKRKTGSSDYKELTDLLDADIITIHVPLNMEGIDKTFHLFDEKILSSLTDNCILINASRGEVVDNKVLNELIPRKNLLAVLDVWENEPGINTQLLEKVMIGTPHIAGYSLEGKVNGTKIIYDSLCRFLNVTPVWSPSLPLIEENVIEVISHKYPDETLNDILKRVYDIETDDKNMRQMVGMNEFDRQNHFDSLRKNYPFRREFSNYSIKIRSKEKDLIKILTAFRFGIIEQADL
jgi:erythronate-4-phosphate dehydrogenase